MTFFKLKRLKQNSKSFVDSPVVRYSKLDHFSFSDFSDFLLGEFFHRILHLILIWSWVMHFAVCYRPIFSDEYFFQNCTRSYRDCNFFNYLEYFAVLSKCLIIRSFLVSYAFENCNYCKNKIFSYILVCKWSGEFLILRRHFALKGIVVIFFTWSFSAK